MMLIAISLKLLSMFLAGDLTCEKSQTDNSYICQIPSDFKEEGIEETEDPRLLDVNCTQYYGAMYCCVKVRPLDKGRGVCVWINEQCTGGAGECE
jgi:hypothetical protein